MLRKGLQTPLLLWTRRRRFASGKPTILCLHSTGTRTRCWISDRCDIPPNRHRRNRSDRTNHRCCSNEASSPPSPSSSVLFASARPSHVVLDNSPDKNLQNEAYDEILMLGQSYPRDIIRTDAGL
ncbi:uncharacterized protein LOC134212946 [Armigeres subalbatus]|uniref:uncharacterized protein LOC134212946 n=1 Tax=Armigeres subalbatus TaxID=124917 RepID=UPI002ED17408